MGLKSLNLIFLDLKFKLNFVWLSGSFIHGHNKYILDSFPFTILEQLGADREKCHISHDGHTFKLNYLTSAIVTINLLKFQVHYSVSYIS